MKIKVGISSCLLGNEVRYDGGHKLDRYLRDTLGQFVEWIPVCPEFECGLGVPREAMRLVGDPQHPRLVTRRTGIDHTERMMKWAGRRIQELEKPVPGRFRAGNSPFRHLHQNTHLHQLREGKEHLLPARPDHERRESGLRV